VAAYQCVKGGETARTHRHTPAALRLVLEAKPGTFTVVNGARVDMMPGDVVLTPSWSWHGHVNETDRTSFWIDFLDIPFVQLSEAMFFEQYPAGGLEPIKESGATPFRIPCAQALGSGSDAKLVEIAKGVMPTIALHLMRQPAGSHVEFAKTTTNNIYAVISGEARFTAEGGLIETLGPGDVIAVPCWHEHAVDAPQDTALLRVSDEPLLAKLGLAKTATH
jgi:gentisate 1,2-dioxygenase